MLQRAEGVVLAVQLMLLMFLLVSPAFIFLVPRDRGQPCAGYYFLAAGLIIGIAATRFCMVGGIRDLIMFKDTHL